MMRLFSKFSLLIGLLLLANASQTFAQTVLDEVNSSGQGDSSGPELFNEKIVKISASRRIFLLTNESAGYDKGDFVSLLLTNQLVVRALVAKLHERQSGLKILKIYNVDLWNKLRSGQEVQVIRGDDSYYKNLANKKIEPKEPDSKIESDDDLYNETTLNDDDLTLEENNNRHIKTDNIITLTYAQVEGLATDGSAQRYGQPGVQWSYQFADNIWGEIGYGQNVIKDLPATGLDTKLTNLTLKLKYTVSAPFNSFVKPYIGYQMLKADSPGAGVDDTGTASQEELNNESDLVQDMNKNTVIFGATLLKRLVPGWFARIDLGTDVYGFGFGLEF